MKGKIWGKRKGDRNIRSDGPEAEGHDAHVVSSTSRAWPTWRTCWTTGGGGDLIPMREPLGVWQRYSEASFGISTLAARVSAEEWNAC
jgi:hypothetical protein